MDMTKPNDTPISYLTALQHLRETEHRQGIEPLQRQDDCPEPSDLLDYALSEAGVGDANPESAARIARHTVDCIYCQSALRSLKAALSGEQPTEMSQDVEDAAALWVM